MYEYEREREYRPARRNEEKANRRDEKTLHWRVY